METPQSPWRFAAADDPEWHPEDTCLSCLEQGWATLDSARSRPPAVGCAWRHSWCELGSSGVATAVYWCPPRNQSAWSGPESTREGVLVMRRSGVRFPKAAPLLTRTPTHRPPSPRQTHSRKSQAGQLRTPPRDVPVTEIERLRDSGLAMSQVAEVLGISTSSMRRAFLGRRPAPSRSLP